MQKVKKFLSFTPFGQYLNDLEDQDGSPSKAKDKIDKFKLENGENGL